MRPHGRLADGVQASDTFTPRRLDRIEDVLHVGEAWRLRAFGSERIADVVRAGDKLRGSIHVRLADGAVVGDAVLTRRHVRLFDAATVGDEWKPVGSPRVRLADGIRIRDRFRPKRAARLADGVQVSDALAARPKVRLTDVVLATDATRPIRYMHMRLGDSFRATDTVVPRGQPRVRLADEVFASERWRLPRIAVAADGHTAHRVGPATAWTTNTDTWGASRYTDFEFNSLAVVDGVLMGTNDDGLWRLDASDDDGAPILAHVQTDMQDYGAEQVKNAPLVYAGVATDGALQLTVDAVIKRTAASYTYTFEPRQAGDFAPGRCKIGRGVRARYMQFTVGNHSGSGALAAGADFTIDSLSVLAEAGSRRV